MSDHASSTLDRTAKGPIAPPPPLEGDLQAVVDAVSAWQVFLRLCIGTLAAAAVWMASTSTSAPTRLVTYISTAGSILRPIQPWQEAGRGRCWQAFPLGARLDRGPG